MDLSDLEQLKQTATDLEIRWDFAAAKTAWQKVLALSPSDRDAHLALKRITAYQQLEADRLATINRLLAVGVALTDSKNLLELMELMLAASREITHSDAGSIYIIDRGDPHHTVVRFLIAQNDSQPDRTLSDFAVPLNNQSLVGYVATTGAVLNIPDAKTIPPTAPYRHHPTFDQDIAYETRSVVVVPMQNSKGEIIGVVQLINRKRDLSARLGPHNTSDLVQPYSEWEVGVVCSLAHQAALLIERNHFLANYYFAE
ncbi:MAG: GAF domain-containing protein [Pseudanabaenaceae cyanobacterium]